MTTNHIDQLAQWWENAEQGTARRGDTLIGKGHGGHFMIYTADCDEEEPDDAVRILARAPKPKPAWRDAVAVIATDREYGGGERRVYTRSANGTWGAENYYGTDPDDLRDVTPLIEAKVTDEMVLAALQARSTYFGNEPAKRIDNYTSDVAEYTRAMLTAALGLETA